MKLRMMFLMIPVMVILAGQSLAQNAMTAERIGDRIEVKINGNLLKNYIMSAYEKYPYFFPVNGPSNGSVTSMRNANYPHHSSLFISCDKLNGGNYWYEGLDRGQIVSLRADIIESGGEKVIIENENIWKRNGGMAPVKDFRTITITAPSAGIIQFDFELSMEMLSNVTIGKTGHSLFCARMAPDLSGVNGGTIVNAEGETGEKNTFGKHSAWIDYHGTRGGKVEGLAILHHPSNEWYPTKWFTREYGFFSGSPTRFLEKDEPLEYKKGETIKFRYRILIHAGDHIEAGIAEQFEKFKNE